ncbi:helix-turn-helix transcriptional regulator [Lentilactobacillus senioris]|uniref:helix-turn-helix domain-containing protein n=1 Tax=Lentilactobacillus senioris TaxID=931534 RepID=UPI002281F1B3|nr:helix-turn-helix transcriptional regulator [Lentilactobacillus senioris]MCY9806175.1 helix-turn-helix transcriptional regulator [Lentilactobacillus senioris]
MLFSEVLNQQRQAKSWTVQDVATKLGVSSETVVNWEAGKHLPNIYQLIQISDLFQVSLDELIKGDATLQRWLGETRSWTPNNNYYKESLFARYWWLIFPILWWISWMVLELNR